MGPQDTGYVSGMYITTENTGARTDSGAGEAMSGICRVCDICSQMASRGSHIDFWGQERGLGRGREPAVSVEVTGACVSSQGECEADRREDVMKVGECAESRKWGWGGVDREREEEREVYHGRQGRKSRAWDRRLSWVVSAHTSGSPALAWTQQILDTRSPRESRMRAGWRPGHRARGQTAVGSSAPGTRPLQAQRGSVCGPKGGHIGWAASGPLLRGAGTAMGHSSPRWGMGASAERQCPLVAGGTHTRLCGSQALGGFACQGPVH